YARMTRLDKLAEIPDRRAELARDFSQIRSTVVREHLVTRTASIMKQLYEGNFHPGVRFNAMLVVGDLDQAPAQLVYQRPPVPYRPSLDLMEAAFLDPKQIEPVRVAALIGIHRHAQ